MMKRTYHSVDRQQGSVLLWGLVILLVLTVVGVAAARMGVTDTRIAGNQLFATMAYQGAESALERVTSLFNIEQTVATPHNEKSWDFEDAAANDGAVMSTGTISMGGSLMCTGQEGFGMSVEMNPDAGGVACRLFTIRSRANLAGTGARSIHAQGILKYAPATGDNLPAN
ncbi:MAG: PilX N-terminal domain-containing pilus assembly protein [Thiolinea sp.]